MWNDVPDLRIMTPSFKRNQIFFNKFKPYSFKEKNQPIFNLIKELHMKTLKLIALSVITLFASQIVTGQTAEEIVAKYINALGGKDQVSKISTVITEGALDAMGSTGTIKHTLLVGKGSKSEIDVQGTSVTFCVTDSAGWSINPMTGNYNAEYMAPEAYKASKDEIFIDGAFGDYAKKGYKLALDGQQTLGAINAYKVTVTTPDSIKTQCFFDPETGYLVQVVQATSMGGQAMDITVGYSDFRKTDAGIVIPFKIETNYGGQFFVTESVNKVDFNQPVDPAIYVKP
jgi:hypothetical protein